MEVEELGGKCLLSPAQLPQGTLALFEEFVFPTEAAHLCLFQRETMGSPPPPPGAVPWAFFFFLLFGSNYGHR